MKYRDDVTIETDVTREGFTAAHTALRQSCGHDVYGESPVSGAAVISVAERYAKGSWPGTASRPSRRHDRHAVTRRSQ